MLSCRFASRIKTLSLLPATLLSVALLDELITGFTVVGLPLIRAQFRLDYTQISLLFTVGALVGMVFEPVISLLSDRGSRRLWVIGGLLGLGIGFALEASAPNYIWLLLGFTLTSLASGAAIGLAQASLIDLAPGASTRAMTRWTLLSSIGDLLSPLSVAVLIGLGAGWSGLAWTAAGAWFALTLTLLLQRFPRASEEQQEDAPGSLHDLLRGLLAALRDPVTLRWGAISLITNMLDEIFVGFSALYLQDALKAAPEQIALIMAVPMFGAMLSLLVLGRLLNRYRPQHLLLWGSLLALSGIVLLLCARVLWLAGVALFLCSLGAASWYPLAEGEMYARHPGRSGTVRAVVSLGGPFEMLLPALTGLIAARFGILAGVAFLGTAPLLVLALVPWRRQISLD